MTVASPPPIQCNKLVTMVWVVMVMTRDTKKGPAKNKEKERCLHTIDKYMHDY
jgi:hypothetical protein